MTLGYTIHEFRLINSLRLYVTGQNLFTITDYSGFDPGSEFPGKQQSSTGCGLQCISVCQGGAVLV